MPIFGRRLSFARLLHDDGDLEQHFAAISKSGHALELGKVAQQVAWEPILLHRAETFRVATSELIHAIDGVGTLRQTTDRCSTSTFEKFAAIFICVVGSLIRVVIQLLQRPMTRSATASVALGDKVRDGLRHDGHFELGSPALREQESSCSHSAAWASSKKSDTRLMFFNE